MSLYSHSTSLLRVNKLVHIQLIINKRASRTSGLYARKGLAATTTTTNKQPLLLTVSFTKRQWQGGELAAKV